MKNSKYPAYQLRLSSFLIALPTLAIALIGTMARAEPLAYVTTAFEDTVSVIDTATNTVKPWLDTAQRNIRLRWGSFVKTLSRGVAPIDWKHRF